MPILQSRMLDLLTEHETNLRATRSLISHIHNVLSCGMTADDKLALVKAELDATSTLHDTTARIERRHFDANAKRNDNKRAKMALKRQASGVTPHNSAQFAMSQRSRSRDIELDRMYDEAMRGHAITQDDLAPHSASTHGGALQSDNAPQYDDTSPDPARWSPERLAQEATRGTLSADDIL